MEGFTMKKKSEFYCFWRGRWTTLEKCRSCYDYLRGECDQMLKCYRCGKPIKEKVIPLEQTSTATSLFWCILASDGIGMRTDT